MFISNPPRDLERYYTGDYHFIPDSVEALDALLPSEKFKIDLLTKFVSGGTLLEIGPSNGMFCRLAQRAGFIVSAIEMNEDCVRFLDEKLGVRVVEIERAGGSTFNGKVHLRRNMSVACD